MKPEFLPWSAGTVMMVPSESQHHGKEEKRKEEFVCNMASKRQRKMTEKGLGTR